MEKTNFCINHFLRKAFSFANIWECKAQIEVFCSAIQRTFLKLDVPRLKFFGRGIAPKPLNLKQFQEQPAVLKHQFKRSMFGNFDGLVAVTPSPTSL